MPASASSLSALLPASAVGRQPLSAVESIGLVQAPEDDRDIKAHDSAAASGRAKDWISCEVADDGDLVHDYLQTEQQGHSAWPPPRCLMRRRLNCAPRRTRR